MSRTNTKLLKAALAALHYARADRAFGRLTQGAGVIFMLHHVAPSGPERFHPNRILSITPEFLDLVIRHILAAGFEVISLDDIPDRLACGACDTPFAAFTFDDGYRDNVQYALPVFRTHGLPFTDYVPSGFPDGEANLWWLTLEEVVRTASSITARLGESEMTFSCVTLAEKERAYHKLYWAFRNLPERQARAVIAALAQTHAVDGAAIAREIVMTWEEVRALASDPLVTIGAHTQHHLALAQLSEDEARAEIALSIARLERELGRPCRHFSYPYGDAASAAEREFRLAREAGVLTAVTTRKGLLHARHVNQLTALPRLSLNGDYQDERFVKVLLSGVPFALRDAVKSLMGMREAA